MGNWSEAFTYTHWRNKPKSPPVYSRDFAYSDSKPVLVAEPSMASLSIRDTSARTFAELSAVAAMSAFVGSPARSHLWFAIGAGEVVEGTRKKDDAENLRKRLLAGPMVDIYVGGERRHWSLHRNLLCHHSPYFEHELVGHEVPKKSKTGENKLELPDDDPKGFELLVKWLYQGTLAEVGGMTDEDKYEYAVACFKLYLLCDKFDMTQLKNSAMDRYRHALHEAQLVPDPDEINEIYRASSVNSPFRRLMTKIAARQIMDPEVDKDAESYRKCFENNPDFAVEMVNAIRYSSGGMLFADPTTGNVCEYHDHSDGQNCPVKGNGKGMMRRIVQNGHNEPKRPPRTPRKLRVPDPSSPEARKSMSHNRKHENGWVSSPEQQHKQRIARSHARLNGVLEEDSLVNGPTGKSKGAQATNSPRKLPDNRFQSIVKQLDGGQRMNGTSDHDSRSVAGESERSKPIGKRQPRKLSVAYATNQGNGTDGINGTHDGG